MVNNPHISDNFHKRLEVTTVGVIAGERGGGGGQGKGEGGRGRGGGYDNNLYNYMRMISIHFWRQVSRRRTNASWKVQQHCSR